MNKPMNTALVVGGVAAAALTAVGVAYAVSSAAASNPNGALPSNRGIGNDDIIGSAFVDDGAADANDDGGADAGAAAGDQRHLAGEQIVAEDRGGIRHLRARGAGVRGPGRGSRRCAPPAGRWRPGAR